MFWAILGISATIIFGLIGVILALKYRNKVELTYIEEECIPLFKSIVQSTDGIEILFNGAPIPPSLVLLKGCMVNTGNLDIDKQNIHEPVSITLPSLSNFLQLKLIETSTNVNATSSFDDNALKLSWDLLKKNEFIKFDALIQIDEALEKTADYSIAKLLFDDIDLSHRITNLDKILKERLPSFPKRRKKRGLALGVFSVLYAFLGIFLIGTRAYMPPMEIHHLIKADSGEVAEILIKPKQDGKIVVEYINDDKKITVHSLNDIEIIKPIIGKSKKLSYPNSAIGVLAFLFGISSSFIIFRALRRQKKLLRLMNLKR